MHTSLFTWEVVNVEPCMMGTFIIIFSTILLHGPNLVLCVHFSVDTPKKTRRAL